MGTPSGRHPRPCFCLCHEPGLHHPDRSFLEFAVHLLALSRRQPAARFQPAALHGRPCRPEGSRKKAALLLGWYPVFIVLAFILQMLVIPLQLLLAQSPFSTYLLAWHLTLLLFGAALGPLLLIRNGVKEMFPDACRACPARSGSGPGSSSCLSWRVRFADASCSTAATHGSACNEKAPG